MSVNFKGDPDEIKKRAVNMKLSGHTIITNPETAGYPYVESIKSFANLCDEVIVVDGGTTDGSLEKIKDIPKVKIVQGDKWKRLFEADEPETSSRAYASPLVVDSNLVPMIKRWEALSGSLEARATFVANGKVPGKRIQELAREFVSMVVTDDQAGTGVPYELEEVVLELQKPSQVLGVKQIWETVDVEPRRLIEAFLKNEQCMKDGRIISSFPDMRYLLLFSAYTLKCRDEVLHGGA